MPTPKATLKGFFSARKKPTQAQFHQWLDSYIHKNEDGLFLDENGNLGIGSAPNGEAKLKITLDSRVSIPHLLLEENGTDFSRLTFKNNQSPKFWTWAGLANAEDDAQSSMNLFHFNGTQGADFLSIKGNGNIGIGTTNPQAKLDINGSIRISVPGNAVPALIIQENGNIGIGTIPSAPLQFANEIRNRKVVLWGSNDHQFYGFGINPSILRYQVDGVNANHVFYSGEGADTSKELLRIRGDGNVGIGTVNPREKLDINGNISVLDIIINQRIGGFLLSGPTQWRIFMNEGFLTFEVTISTMPLTIGGIVTSGGTTVKSILRITSDGTIQKNTGTNENPNWTDY